MFEKSFVASRAGAVSDRRWIWVLAIGLQSLAACLAVVQPMLSPERMRVVVPHAMVPLALVHREPKPVTARRVEIARETSVRVPALPMLEHSMGRLPSLRSPTEEPVDAPVIGMGPMRMGVGGDEVIAAVATGGGPGSRVAGDGAGGARRGPVRVSSGVGAGMLKAPIRPVYPAIARAAGLSGAVVVEAVISREGGIERARVVSGPAMLATAALDAVRQARYTPYRLNGEPTEVETTITVNFRMGG